MTGSQSAQSAVKFPGEREFVVLMATVQALQALAIDVMLPALGVMAKELGAASANDRQLVVSVYLIGIGLGTLVPGTLADRFGRRPVLFTCLGFYISTSIACAFVQDFNMLLVFRAIQALGCSGLSVLPPAILRDRFQGDRMARMQSLVTVVFLAVPILAPALGQVVTQLLSWRWIFGAMAILASLVGIWAWYRLPETMPQENRRVHGIGTIAVDMIRVVTTRSSIGYVLASTLTMSAVWGYIATSQQLIAEGFGAGDKFPYVFGAVIVGMVIGNMINARIVDRFGARRVSHTAMLLFIAAAGVQVWMSFSPHQTLLQFSLIMSVNMGLVGFIGANSSSIALQPFSKAAGAASSVQAFLRMVIAALLSTMIGQSYDGTARPLAIALLACGVTALLLVLFSEGGRLFRRREPPGTHGPQIWGRHERDL